jgi:DNA-binding NarL/FixJ family response regulator
VKLQRVLLVDGSLFLRDILRRVFEKTPGFSVVGEVNNFYNLPMNIRETHANWVVISLPPGGKLPDHFRTLMLTEFPSIRVMGISTDGSEVRVEWVGFHEKGFRELTFEGLQRIFNANFYGDEEEDL